jgi:hypothetical protein
MDAHLGYDKHDRAGRAQHWLVTLARLRNAGRPGWLELVQPLTAEQRGGGSPRRLRLRAGQERALTAGREDDRATVNRSPRRGAYGVRPNLASSSSCGEAPSGSDTRGPIAPLDR